jgi:hypothetical protein
MGVLPKAESRNTLWVCLYTKRAWEKKSGVCNPGKIWSALAIKAADVLGK